MRRLFGVVLTALLTALPGAAASAAPSASAGAYRNFRAAVYVVVDSTQALADRATFERQYARVAGQVHFDKVYIEVYRDRTFATDAEIETVKRYFREKGVAVAGGVTLAAGGKGGQFGTFDYEIAADRDECRKAAELAARHFDEVILDDFFFYTSKSDADIRAKGARSWTDYRLDVMRTAAADLVVGPAHAVNPNVRMVIKYPNWYEHFQGLGYDLDKEARIFDGIYAGTETRDPTLTDQLLQQYESYEIIRYYANIRPDWHNIGGWVDTGSLRTADRYVEQLRDTLLAKAPEITLFCWYDLVGPRPPTPLDAWFSAIKPDDETAWTNKTFYKAMRAGYRQTPSAFAGMPPPPLGWALAAGHAFADVDKVLGQLGKPIGIAAYKPYQSRGEDFLQNYLGNVGLPIEMTPAFPDKARLVLLTESAARDVDIIAKIKRLLQSGGSVVVTPGFLRATQDKGLRDIVEWETTGKVALVGDFINGFGAGNGESLNDAGIASQPVLFPEVRFYTNDSWAIIRGVAGAKGYPILLSNAYAQGTIYLLNVPENPADLYRLPQGALSQIKAYLMADAVVRLQGPASTSLFTYDNGAFVAVNYRNETSSVDLSVAGTSAVVRDLKTGKTLVAQPVSPEERLRRDTLKRWSNIPERTVFRVTLDAHDFGAYRVETGHHVP